eukprot:Sspe_Gene.31428::Locus_15511_Transcript_1_1_Confidence_1.000_Length_1658::g.31428::m.31428/K08796/BRSK; BR serine/threonine kinase
MAKARDEKNKVVFSVPLPGGRRTTDWVFFLGDTLHEYEGCIKVKEAVGGEPSGPEDTRYLMRVVLLDELAKHADSHNLSARIYREIDMLKMIDHPNVAKLFQVFTSSDKTAKFVLMERTTSTLADKLRKNPHGMPVSEARTIFAQLVSAVKYIHDKGIVHRAISPETVLFDDSDNTKLGGFHSSCPQSGRELLSERPMYLVDGYIPPELEGERDPQPHHGKKVDTWALGAVLHAMVTGHPPGKSNTLTDIAPDLRDLLQRMLEANWMEGRITLADVEKHPWLLTKRGSRSKPPPVNTSFDSGARLLSPSDSPPPGSGDLVDNTFSPLPKTSQRRHPAGGISPDRDHALSPAAAKTMALPFMSLSPPGSPASKTRMRLAQRDPFDPATASGYQASPIGFRRRFQQPLVLSPKHNEVNIEGKESLGRSELLRRRQLDMEPVDPKSPIAGPSPDSQALHKRHLALFVIAGLALVYYLRRRKA